MYQLQRDMGRIEATLENAVETIQDIRQSQAEMRSELGDIKTALSNQKAVNTWNWKIIGSVSAFSVILTQLVNYIKLNI